MLSVPALASGLLFDTNALPKDAAEALSAGVAGARVESPRAFDAVATLARDADVIFAKRRGGVVAPMGRAFKNMGPEALWPMLSLLAADAEGLTPKTEGGRNSLAVGLLEALEALQDSRAEPVLRAAVSHKELSPLITRAAASAYGFLQTDDAAAYLVALAQGDGPHARAVLNGMGSCRRLAVAQALGAAIDRTTDVRERVELARTLGDVGNSWAWQTPGVTARHEEAQVRAAAAAALLKAYLAWDGDAQSSAAKAVLVVDAPQTSTLIAGQLAHAPAKDAAALKALADRVAHNPLHRQ